MAQILRFVDPTNLTPSLDLNDPSAWCLARGLDLGRQSTERTYLVNPPLNGGELVRAWRPIVQMTIPLLLCPVPDDATIAMTDKERSELLEQLIQDLNIELDRRYNAIEYLPDDLDPDDGTYIMDTLRGDQITLHRGETALPSSWRLKQGGFPIVLTLDRQPEMRGRGSQI